MKDFNIPLLTAEDIDCRVQSVSKTKNGTVGAVLLLYKEDVYKRQTLYNVGRKNRKAAGASIRAATAKDTH